MIPVFQDGRKRGGILTRMSRVRLNRRHVDAPLGKWSSLTNSPLMSENEGTSYCTKGINGKGHVHEIFQPCTPIKQMSATEESQQKTLSRSLFFRSRCKPVQEEFLRQSGEGVFSNTNGEVPEHEACAAIRLGIVGIRNASCYQVATQA